MPTPKPFRVGPFSVYAERGPRDDGAWYWKAKRRGGDRRYVWTGWATPDAALEAVLDVVQTSHAEDLARSQERPGSVAALMSAWLAAEVLPRQDITEHTRKGYQRDAGHVVEALGTRRASSMTNATIAEYRDGRLSGGSAPSTVMQEIKRLLTAWRWAQGRRMVPDRALARPKMRATPVRSQHTPTEAEVLAVRDALGPRWAKVALDLIWASGARVGEIATLRWRDIHVRPDGRGYLEIAGKRTSRNPGGRRTFPLNKRVRVALEGAQRGAPGDTVTGVTATRVRAHLTMMMGSTAEGLGFPRFGAHRVRAAVEDRMARAGVELKVYAALLGHSEEVAIRIYRRATAADLFDGAELDDI